MTAHAPEYAPPPERWYRRRLFALGVARTSGGRLQRAGRSAAWSAFVTLLAVENPAVRGRRIDAARTLWRCQLLRRQGRRYEIDLGPAGRLLCPPWSAMGALTAATGAHEPGEQRFVERCLRTGDTVIDAGANIGFYAVPLARAGARVISFEPGAAARELLEANVAHNHLDGVVRVEPVALADFDGRALLTTDEDVANHLVLGDGESSATEAVEVRTLDTASADHADWLAAAELVVLKIDVEGFDEQVLRGAAGLLAKYRPVVMIETRGGGDPVRDLLTRDGFVCHWYDVAAEQLVRLPASWHGNYEFHTNVIAVPHERVEQVLDRLRTAPAHPWPAPTVRPLPA